MKTVPPSSAFRPGRHLEVLDDPLHDPYQARAKLADPSVCGTCHAVYHKGRWQWRSQAAMPQVDAAETMCPACHRIHDHQPAGYVSIEGEFAAAHRGELLSLVKHLEEREKAEHPLQRIMSIEDIDGKLVVTTTDTHLARGIGEALEHAYKGKADYAFGQDEHMMRVHWQR